jgi:hypothetical protein
MSHEKSQENELIIKKTKESFSTWIHKPYISEELRKQLEKANVLLVPKEGFRSYSGPVFPVGTEEFLNYLREFSAKGINANICIEDKDYKELALHEAFLIISAFVVTSLVAPIVTDLISEFIKRRWMKEDKNKDNNIKIELTVVKKDGSSASFLYEGPAKAFTKTVKPALISLAKQENLGETLGNQDKQKEIPNDIQ